MKKETESAVTTAYKFFRYAGKLKKELDAQRRTNQLLKEQQAEFDAWGRNACKLIKRQLRVIEGAADTPLSYSEIQNQRNIVDGFMADRLTMLVRIDLIDMPNIDEIERIILGAQAKIASYEEKEHTT